MSFLFLLCFIITILALWGATEQNYDDYDIWYDMYVYEKYDERAWN